MTRRKSATGKDCLPFVEQCAKRAFSRKDAIRLAAEFYETTQNSVRLARWKKGNTTPQRSLKYAFTEEEEKLLEAVCVIHARAGRALSKDDFLELATIFAGRGKKHHFSTQFLLSFADRHDDVLFLDDGKITSPTRCLDTTQKKIQEFISLLNRYMKGNTMNKRKIFVFDGTFIGDSDSVPVVIGERRKSGGGNINAIRIRKRALNCYISFSMPDGTTPFRVFIFKSGSKKQGRILQHALVPRAERELRARPHRLFLQSEKGFLTNHQFKIIMEDFTKWWTTTHPGLHRFMISDNLSVHRNEQMVKTAEMHGVHVLNIMPGTCHWFQVHDQLSFANLKKRNEEKKKNCLAFSATHAIGVGRY